MRGLQSGGRYEYERGGAEGRIKTARMRFLKGEDVVSTTKDKHNVQIGFKLYQ